MKLAKITQIFGAALTFYSIKSDNPSIPMSFNSNLRSGGLSYARNISATALPNPPITLFFNCNNECKVLEISSSVFHQLVL